MCEIVFHKTIQYIGVIVKSNPTTSGLTTDFRKKVWFLLDMIKYRFCWKNITAIVYRITASDISPKIRHMFFKNVFIRGSMVEAVRSYASNGGTYFR